MAEAAIDAALGVLQEHSPFEDLVTLEQDLILHLYADKTKNLFASLSPTKLSKARIGKLDASARETTRNLGLHDGHFENPDSLGSKIVAKVEFAHPLYLAAFYFYACRILECIVDGEDAGPLFRKQLVLNERVASAIPRPACLLLTPLMSLAALSDQPKLCKIAYVWRNGGHPDFHLNRLRRQLDGDKEFGTEAAIKLLSNYNCLKFLSDRLDDDVSHLLDQTKKTLFNLGEKYTTSRLPSANRYYDRFRAGLHNNEDLYFKSECYAATSHHLFFGRVSDEFLP